LSTHVSPAIELSSQEKERQLAIQRELTALRNRICELEERAERNDAITKLQNQCELGEVCVSMFGATSVSRDSTSAPLSLASPASPTPSSTRPAVERVMSSLGGGSSSSSRPIVEDVAVPTPWPIRSPGSRHNVRAPLAPSIDCQTEIERRRVPVTRQISAPVAPAAPPYTKPTVMSSVPMSSVPIPGASLPIGRATLKAGSLTMPVGSAAPVTTPAEPTQQLPMSSIPAATLCPGPRPAPRLSAAGAPYPSHFGSVHIAPRTDTGTIITPPRQGKYVVEAVAVTNVYNCLRWVPS